MNNIVKEIEKYEKENYKIRVQTINIRKNNNIANMCLDNIKKLNKEFNRLEENPFKNLKKMIRNQQKSNYYIKVCEKVLKEIKSV